MSGIKEGSERKRDCGIGKKIDKNWYHCSNRKQ